MPGQQGPQIRRPIRTGLGCQLWGTRPIWCPFHLGSTPTFPNMGRTGYGEETTCGITAGNRSLTYSPTLSRSVTNFSYSPLHPLTKSNRSSPGMITANRTTSAQSSMLESPMALISMSIICPMTIGAISFHTTSLRIKEHLVLPTKRYTSGIGFLRPPPARMMEPQGTLLISHTQIQTQSCRTRSSSRRPWTARLRWLCRSAPTARIRSRSTRGVYSTRLPPSMDAPEQWRWGW